MSRLASKAMRGILIGLEQEPVVMFSCALGALSVVIAVVVPPLRGMYGGVTRSYNTGAMPVAQMKNSHRDAQALAQQAQAQAQAKQ